MWQTSAFLFRLYFNNFEICSVFVRLLLVSLFGEKFTAAKMISFSSFYSKWVPHRTFLTCQLCSESNCIWMQLKISVFDESTKKIVLNESRNYFFCNTSLPLARTRWVQSTFSSGWSLSYKQCCWVISATLTIISYEEKFKNTGNLAWGKRRLTFVFRYRLESLLGLTRDRMIFMALVLGCDFFPTGIPGGTGNPWGAAKSPGCVALPRMAEIRLSHILGTWVLTKTCQANLYHEGSWRQQ